MKKLAIILTIVMMLGVILSPAAVFAQESTYEQTLFDRSKLIEIDIQMDQDAWDQMIATASKEEYSSCNVMVNGVLYENVGIRPKGNSSKSSVTSRGSERYSWRIKFDKYEKGRTCDGLDVLILNNGFKDPGELREAISYDMYAFLDADASLYNYAVISVNGEYFGVYLALECVDESFAERNYGEDYGQLYKPDIADMGDRDGDDGESEGDSAGDREGGSSAGQANGNGNEAAEDAEPNAESSGESQDGERPAEQADVNGNEVAENTAPNAESSGESQDGERPADQADVNGNETDENTEQNAESSGESQDGERPTRTEGEWDAESNGDSQGGESPAARGEGEEADGESRGGSGGGSSTDVMALNYVDDNLETYQRIWDSGKFKSDDEDHARVVEALKHVCQGDNIKDYLDVDNVLRYFAIQTFIYNHDGLTGNVSHNYYLYEEDGKLNLIPWDMNESFTISGNGKDYVNFPIDTPFTVTDLSARSFFMSILEDEECLEKYHEYLRQLSEEYALGGVLEETLERIHSQIDELVQTDPTAFSTYESFESASESLLQAVQLRAQGVLGQLDGEIPSTREGQTAEPDKLLDTSGADFSGLSEGSGMGWGR